MSTSEVLKKIAAAVHKAIEDNFDFPNEFWAKPIKKEHPDGLNISRNAFGQKLIIIIGALRGGEFGSLFRGVVADAAYIDKFHSKSLNDIESDLFKHARGEYLKSGSGVA
jgi:hypothetical protein